MRPLFLLKWARIFPLSFEPSFSGIVTVNKCIILATAKVHVFNMDGRRVILKALLEKAHRWTWSQRKPFSFWVWKKNKSGVTLFGIGNTPAGVVKHSAFSSNYNRFKIYDNYRYNFDALVMQIMNYEITKVKPFKMKTAEQWPHLMGINLAESRFNVSEKIAQQSKLGWFLSGTVEMNSARNAFCNDYCLMK